MKMLLLVLTCITFAMASSAAQAQEKVLLGKGNFAAKFAYINFTDDYFDDDGRQDDGIYIGLEGYGKIFPNLYLGGEIGQAINIDIFGEEITYVPIELNLKYAIEATSNFVIDFGAGVSYNYVEIEDQDLFGSGRQEDDWLFGGQFFGDLTYIINWFSIGASAKYQITEDFQNEDFNLNNLRFGVQVGVIF